MTKTAVILSGQARTYARVFANQKWQVYDKLTDPHFYVSVADDADAHAVNILRNHYPKDRVFIEVVKQPDLPEPDFAHTYHAPYAITPTRTPGVGPLQGIMRQLWHNSRAYNFAIGEGASQCSQWVRIRPDLHFHKFDDGLTRKLPVHDESSNVTHFVKYTAVVQKDEALTPYWGRYGGSSVNDRFALLGHEAAGKYFHTYDKIPEMLEAGVPFHPETLVGESLIRGGITVHRTLCAEFAFCRKPDAQHGDYWFEHMQVLPGELAEYTAHLSKQ